MSARPESVNGRPERTARRLLSFTVVGTPAPQGSKTGFVVGGRAVITDKNPTSLRSWRQDVRQAALEALPDGWPVDGAFTVSLAFRLPRPRSHPKSKGLRVTKRPDLDKLVRATFDALGEARVYGDDSQVWSLRACKKYEEPGFPPGCDVAVWCEPVGAETWGDR